MKVLIIVLVAALAGCATGPREPLTFEQRMQLIQTLNANRYVVPMPVFHPYNPPPAYNCVQTVAAGPATYACQPQ